MATEPSERDMERARELEWSLPRWKDDRIATIAQALADARAEGRREGVEAAAKVADLYADVNIEQAGDTILLDPCLNGDGFTPENLRASESLIVDGCVHASRFHAAQDIASAIRALATPPEPQGAQE